MAAGSPAFLTMRRAERKMEAVHDEVRTNHGRPAREYLEMIAEVKTAVELVAAGQAAVVKLIGEHTLQDERNFNDLRTDMKVLAAKVSSAD